MTIVSVALLLGIITLAALVIQRVVADRREAREDKEARKLEAEKVERFNALATNVGTAASELRLISIVSRHIAVDCLKDNPTLRADLIQSLEHAGAVCADCPLRNSSICDECGRETIGSVGQGTNNIVRGE